MRNFQIIASNKLTANCLLTCSYYTRPHLEYGGWVYVKNILGSQIYSLVYKFNVFHKIRESGLLESVFCNIYYREIINTTCNTQLNTTKQLFLNIYHFPSILVLLKYQNPFIEYAIFESCLSCSFLVYAQSFSITPCFYKQSIFDPRPKNCLSFSKKPPQKLFSNCLGDGLLTSFYCLNIQTFETSP